MNTGEYEKLICEQKRIEKDIKALEDNHLRMANHIDEIRSVMDERYNFFRKTLQNHIDSRIAHNASTDIIEAMLELVREGKASMTVSYNLYPVEKGEENDGG